MNNERRTAIQALADAGLAAAIQRIGCVMEETSKTMTSMKHEPNTQRAYEKHFRGLRKFFERIGDYDSLIILEEKPPKHFCPSMRPESIDLYVQWKRRDPDEYPLLLDRDDNLVKDVLGEPIPTDGKWSDPRNLDQLYSAIGDLHLTRKQNGPYKEVCELCAANAILHEIPKGCRWHPLVPQVWSAGNPTESRLLKHTKGENTKNGSSYQASGDSAILPHELLDIRDHLIGSEATTLWTWNFINIEFEDIQENLSLITTDLTLESLVIKIQGKSDKSPVYLTLWRDDTFPQLCPIRHLLIYVKLLGVVSGFLFPDRDQLTALLASPNPDKSVKNNISYDAYQTAYKNLCHKVIKRPGPFGTHPNRKTGYLFAVWGDGGEAEIMLSARHKSISSSAKYRKDASTLLELYKRKTQMDNSESVIPKLKWTSVYNQDLQIVQRIANNGDITKLPVLAERFFTDHCKINPARPDYSIRRALISAEEYSSAPTIRDNINRIVKGHLNQTLADDLLTLIELYVLQRRNATKSNPSGIEPQEEGQIGEEDVAQAVDGGGETGLREEEQRDGEGTMEIETTRSSTHLSPKLKRSREDDVVVNTGEKRKRRGGVNDLPERFRLAEQKSGEDKLNFLITFEGSLSSDDRDTSTLTDAARNFCNMTMAPILLCFRDHCGGDQELFIRKWGNFAPSTFSRTRCKGKGGQCGVGVKRPGGGGAPSGEVFVVVDGGEGRRREE
ncbi:hypothetical protein BC829DRAFT_439525 [Chytridium lagenaria]|nr:hypothetical protein BC829DRAFT_439525 [Chytridium lagenaria]